MDLYLFDFDNTLYAYDSRRRLPAQSRLSGVSQYHLAKTWWAAGFERRAEAGEWPTADAYLDQFAAVTGARLTLAQWVQARSEASTATTGVVDEFRRASTRGTASLLSNNPSPFVEGFTSLAPDVSAIAGPNLLVSCMLGARKPSALAYRRALDAYGANAADTFLVDDSAENIAGAASLGITAHRFLGATASAVADLHTAIDRFSARKS